VSWLDACTGEAGWKTLGDVKRIAQLLPVESCGFFAHSDKEQLTLVGSIARYEPPLDYADLFGEVQIIPWNGITKVEKLR